MARLNAGDQVYHKKFGGGVVLRVDESQFADKQFTYLCDFEDGTKVWLPANSARWNRVRGDIKAVESV